MYIYVCILPKGESKFPSHKDHTFYKHNTYIIFNDKYEEILYVLDISKYKKYLQVNYHKFNTKYYKNFNNNILIILLLQNV